MSPEQVAIIRGFFADHSRTRQGREPCDGEISFLDMRITNVPKNARNGNRGSILEYFYFLTIFGNRYYWRIFDSIFSDYVFCPKSEIADSAGRITGLIIPFWPAAVAWTLPVPPYSRAVSMDEYLSGGHRTISIQHFITRSTNHNTGEQWISSNRWSRDGTS
jgi:hypothetical protein